MIEWLTDTLVATGALMALVLLVRKPVGRWFGSGAAYALWTLPMIRLVLPPLALPRGLLPDLGFGLEAAPASAGVPVEVVIASSAVASSAEPVAVPGLLAQFPWSTVLVTAWLCGAALFLAWRIGAYRAMRQDLLQGARFIGHDGDVRIVESPAAYAPLAFGVFDKVIALPVGFLGAVDSETSDLAIAHELEHHAGSDLLALMAMQPLFALHWFNPIAWAAWRAVRSDQEAACDGRVMAGRDGHAKALYGRLIASFAGGTRLALVAPMAGPLSGEKPIIHRLKALRHSEVGTARRFLGRSLFAAAVIGLPATATVSHAAMDDVGVADAPPQPEVPLAPPVTARAAPETAPEAPQAVQVPTVPAALQWSAAEPAVIAAPASPAPPAPPAPAAPGTRVMIEKRVVRTGDARQHAEDAERMAAEAIARAPVVEESVSPDGQRKTIRIVRRMGDGKPPVARAMILDQGCPSDSGRREARSEHDGTHVAVVVCTGKPRAAATAVVAALTSARNAIAADSKLDAKVRAEVLADLDSEIADARREAHEGQD